MLYGSMLRSSMLRGSLEDDLSLDLDLDLDFASLSKESSRDTLISRTNASFSRRIETTRPSRSLASRSRESFASRTAAWAGEGATE